MESSSSLSTQWCPCLKFCTDGSNRMYRVIRYKPLQARRLCGGVCVRSKKFPHPHSRCQSPVVCVPQTKGFQANYVWLILAPLASTMAWWCSPHSSQRNTSALVTNHEHWVWFRSVEELSENAFWNPIKIFQINVGKRVNPPPTCGIVPHVERPSPPGLAHALLALPASRLESPPLLVRRRCKAWFRVARS